MGIRSILSRVKRRALRTLRRDTKPRDDSDPGGPSGEEVQLARKAIIMLGASKEQLGLEIGPMHRPLAPKKEGYNVEIVDHLNREELIERGKELGIPLDDIEEVDYIWDGKSTYSDLIGKTGCYDYIIASHVIEHVPVFVSFINDCANLLKPNGMLRLAVPDKRYTLDHFRTVTTTGKMIDDYVSESNLGTIGTFIDFSLNTIHRTGREPLPLELSSWPQRLDYWLPNEYRFIHSRDEIRRRYENSLKEWTYQDVHQHVFTPASFKLIIKDLIEYGLINMDIELLHETHEEEFIVLLKKTDSPVLLSDEERMALLRQASHENVIS